LGYPFVIFQPILVNMIRLSTILRSPI